MMNIQTIIKTSLGNTYFQNAFNINIIYYIVRTIRILS